MALLLKNSSRKSKLPIMDERRSNQQWLDELRGDKGVDAQQEAHLDLATYLYVVARNYLRYRRSDINALHTLAEEELNELARDYAQDLLEKFTANQFAQLSKFRGDGKFTSWAAQCLRNDIAGLLRRAPFTRDHVGLNDALALPADGAAQDRFVVRAEVVMALENCLEQLQDHYRVCAGTLYWGRRSFEDCRR